MRAAERARESYVGPWLPEPLLTTPDVAEHATIAESVSMAMLVVLQTLSPLERAVFVLREAFGFGYRDVAAALGRSEPAVRQLVHRAREHVQARRPRFFAAIAPDIPPGTEIHIAPVNGVPAGVATLQGLPYAVFVLDLTEFSQVDRILLVANPDKLTGLSRAWPRR